MAGSAVVSSAGLLLAALSMLGNGTFGIFAKLCRREPDPILFNAFLAVGILVSSLLAIPFFPLVAGGRWPLAWTWAGALSGGLLVTATGASFVAISLSGLATAQATWSCAAIVVSCLWGVLGPRRGGRGPGAPVGDAGLTTLSIVLLVWGVVVINLAEQISAKLCGRSNGGARSYLGVPPQVHDEAPLLEGQAGGEHQSGVQAVGRGSGWRASARLLPALVVGASGGSILAPSAFVPRDLAGLPLLPSFGIAAGVLGVLVFVAYWVLFLRQPLSLRADSALAQELCRETVLYGIASGFFWNAGNICQIIALTYLHMPYGVSYPILQCALVVAGLWGIVVFKEVARCGQVVVFFAGVCVLLCGVVLLGSFGPGS